MAYMNQEKKRRISAAVKPILSKYGVKGTLAVRNHSTIVLNISSGSIDFIGDMAEDRPNGYGGTIDKNKLREDYALDINPYWYNEHYTGTSRQFLSEIFPALKAADWYDESDAMVDYFNTAYYVDVNVGKWNKPYTLTK